MRNIKHLPFSLAAVGTALLFDASVAFAQQAPVISPEIITKIQQVITQEKAKQQNIKEITVNAPATTGGGGIKKIASTTLNAAGQPADAKAVASLENNTVGIAKTEEGFHVSVPVKNKAGTPIATAGVHVNDSIGKAKELAFAIAKQLEQTMGSAK